MSKSSKKYFKLRKCYMQKRGWETKTREVHAYEGGRLILNLHHESHDFTLESINR